MVDTTWNGGHYRSGPYDKYLNLCDMSDDARHVLEVIATDQLPRSREELMAIAQNHLRRTQSDTEERAIIRVETMLQLEAVGDFDYAEQVLALRNAIEPLAKILNWVVIPPYSEDLKDAPREHPDERD